jgi:hypothetical protein
MNDLGLMSEPKSFEGFLIIAFSLIILIGFLRLVYIVIVVVPDNGWREQPDLFCRPDVQPGESGTVWQSRVGRPAVRPAPAVHPEASSRTRWKQKSGLREGLPRSDIF